VSPQYYAQPQHQLEVSRAAELHYWTFDGSAGSLIRLGPDPEYLKRLLDAEAAFWQLVRDNVWPEPAGVNLETYRKTPVPVVRINFLEPGGLR
jgi:hypothetical protein